MAAIVHDFKFQFMIFLVFFFVSCCFSSPKQKKCRKRFEKIRSSFEKNKIRKFSIYQTDKIKYKKKEFFILFRMEFSMLCDMHFFVLVFFSLFLRHVYATSVKFIDVRESIYLRIFTLHFFFVLPTIAS
jgi:hypothetical protein